MKTAGGSTIVKDFVQTGDRQTVMRVKLRSGRAYYKLVELGLRPQRNTEFKVRLVRVELDDGTVRNTDGPPYSIRNATPTKTSNGYTANAGGWKRRSSS